MSGVLAIAPLVAMVIAALVLPPRWDPAMWLKKRFGKW